MKAALAFVRNNISVQTEFSVLFWNYFVFLTIATRSFPEPGGGDLNPGHRRGFTRTPLFSLGIGD